MNIPDTINGLFEGIGGVMCWINFVVLLKDKMVKGVSLNVMGFFCCFSLWNMYYYPHLNQTLSFYGAAFLMVGNWAWLILAIYYKYRRNL